MMCEKSWHTPQRLWNTSSSGILIDGDVGKYVNSSWMRWDNSRVAAEKGRPGVNVGCAKSASSRAAAAYGESNTNSYAARHSSLACTATRSRTCSQASGGEDGRDASTSTIPVAVVTKRS